MSRTEVEALDVAVSRTEVETFRRRIRDLRQKYEHALDQIEQDLARRKRVDWVQVKGSGRDVALEVHARIYLIDPLLKELGWDVSSPTTIVVEDAVEAVSGSADSNRRFLDYHGRDNAEGRSLVIIEAKRPNSALPDPDKDDIPAFFAQALRDMRLVKVEGPKLPGKWQEWVESLVDYADRAMSNFGHVAVRVLITNGEWFVVFKNVEATLLSDNPVKNNILVFSSLRDVEARSEEFYDLFSYRVLSGHIPPQHPSELPEFVPDDHEALCAQVVDLSYVRHGARQPAISVRVAAWVRSDKGGWIFFSKSYPEEFLLLSSNPETLQKVSEELSTRAKHLIRELNKCRTIRLIPAEEFEKLAAIGDFKDGVSRSRGSHLIMEIDDNMYRLTLGDRHLYLSSDLGYSGCSFHFHGVCHNQGDAAGAAPILAPSSDPRAFFPSGSSHHCAHRAIHNARKNICILLCFEEYLCCRGCAFFERCWPDGGTNLPCRND